MKQIMGLPPLHPLYNIFGGGIHFQIHVFWNLIIPIDFRKPKCITTTHITELLTKLKALPQSFSILLQWKEHSHRLSSLVQIVSLFKYPYVCKHIQTSSSTFHHGNDGSSTHLLQTASVPRDSRRYPNSALESAPDTLPTS